MGGRRDQSSCLKRSRRRDAGATEPVGAQVGRDLLHAHLAHRPHVALDDEG